MWYHPSTGAQYAFHHDIRAAFPHISFCDTLSDERLAQSDVGVFPLAQTPPVFDRVTQAVTPAPPVLEGGVWTQQWAVTTLAPEQAAQNLAAAKSDKNAQINAARLQANRSSFTHAGKAIACDELSRGDIDGINGFVALTGALPPGWPGGWKAVDNSIVPVPDVAAWAALYGAMVAAGNANFAHAQALKAQLAAATTAAEVEAVQW